MHRACAEGVVGRVVLRIHLHETGLILILPSKEELTPRNLHDHIVLMSVVSKLYAFKSFAQTQLSF